MKPFITKLKPKAESKTFINFYCNFETVVSNNLHYVNCYSIVRTDICKSNIITMNARNELESQSNALINEFLRECINLYKLNSNANTKVLFLFHNLNKFDSFFILKNLINSNELNVKIVTRNSLIYRIIAEDRNSKIRLEFRDSSLLLPISLEKISETFCSGRVKSPAKFDNTIDSYFNNVTFNTNSLNFCISNSMLIEEGFEKFLAHIRDILKIEPLSCLSLAGIALRHFKLKHYNERQYPIERLCENKDSFIRESYRGGVVEVFKPHLKNGFHYDANSLYPYVMKTSNMPIGKGKWVDKIDIKNFFGFVKVKVTAPENLKKPFLTVHDSKLGLISPLGSWTETYFSEEIKYALTLGYTFKYLRGISYEKGVLFDTFVDEMYDIRLSTAKDSSLNILMKLMMNSLYGRFGMKTSMLQSKIISSYELQKYISIYDVKDIIEMHGKLLINFEPKVLTNKLDILLDNDILTVVKCGQLAASVAIQNENSAVHIASAITAYGRIFMDGFKQNDLLDVYYSDTDSIFCKNKLNSENVSPTKLGSFKLENSILEGLFLAPKMYMLKTHDGAKIVKCKGIESSLMTEEDFRVIYNNSSNPFTRYINYTRRDIYSLTISEEKRLMNISAKLLKREKIIISGIWVDTSPLRVNGYGVRSLLSIIGAAMSPEAPESPEFLVAMFLQFLLFCFSYWCVWP